MSDVILVAVIVAFFALAALVVRALGRVMADSGDRFIPDNDEAAADDAGQDRQPAGPRHEAGRCR
jgi:hypothetical protein